jgi:hypothetical protein
MPAANGASGGWLGVWVYIVGTGRRKYRDLEGSCRLPR